MTATTVRRLAAVATLVAGALHYAAVPEHRAGSWLAGALFAAVGAFQFGWPVLVWNAAGRRALLAGLAVDAAVLAAWTVSRTSGLPFGDHPGVAEPVRALDLACGVAEGVAVLALGVLLGSPGGLVTARASSYRRFG